MNNINNKNYYQLALKELLDKLLSKNKKLPKFSDAVDIKTFIKKYPKFTKKFLSEYKLNNDIDRAFQDIVIYEYFSSSKVNKILNNKSKFYLKKNNFNKLLKKVIKRGSIYKKTKF
jgi:hypothetical protein